MYSTEQLADQLHNVVAILVGLVNRIKSNST